MEKQITLSLEKARELYGKDKNLDVILLQNFTEKELTEKGLPKTWDELEYIGGYYINSNSLIKYDANHQTCYEHSNLFKTEKQAKSALAMAQLSQLMYVYNDGWTPNWGSSETKCAICRVGKNLETHEVNYHYRFLSFKTHKIAIEFIKNFERLIKDYYEID